MLNTTKESLIKSFKNLISDLPEKQRKELVRVVNALLKAQKNRDDKECKEMRTKQSKLL